VVRKNWVADYNFIQTLIIWSIPVLFAITVHEVAHGWVALKRGDRTAQMMGRLTLNPLKHIDPLGTVVLPILLLYVGGFIFGWAKPVPVTYQNLHKPKTDMAWVALAGPMSNFVMAVIWALISKLGLFLYQSGISVGEPMMLMGTAGMVINAMLMMLNLLPLPPLDGGRVLLSVLPGPISWQLSRLEPYGFFILIGLLALGVLTLILSPLVNGLLSLLVTMMHLPPQLFSLI
jgi:Zn-dependent protease